MFHYGGGIAMAGESLVTIPARRGKAALVVRGQMVRVVNTHGQQVVDRWAFCRDDLTEFMSMEHSRTALERIMEQSFPLLGAEHPTRLAFTPDQNMEQSLPLLGADHPTSLALAPDQNSESTSFPEAGAVSKQLFSGSKARLTAAATSSLLTPPQVPSISPQLHTTVETGISAGRNP